MFITHTKSRVVIVCGISALIFMSCGDSDNKAGKHTGNLNTPEALYEKAEKSFAQNDFETTLTLTDSLVKIPGVKIDLLKQAHNLNLRARENDALIKLKEADQAIQTDSAEITKIGQQLQRYKIGDTDPFLTDKTSYNSKLADQTGISARIDPNLGYIYITASLNGQTGMRYLTLSADGTTTATDTLSRENVASASTGEMATFSNLGSYRLAEITDGVDSAEKITLTFHNSSGKAITSRKLTANELRSLKTAKSYTDIAQRLSKALTEREHQQQILQKVREQLGTNPVNQTNEQP